LIVASFLAVAVYTYAQSTPPPTDPAISRLAAHIAEILRKAHAKKVVVAELKGPDGKVHPVGKYLADRLSESLQKEFPGLQVIDRSQEKANTKDNGDAEDKTAALERTKAWARNLGANFVVTGSFAKVSQGIGVSLSAMFCNDSSRWYGVTNGLVPITDEITALSSDPIPSPTNGISRAGVGGVTAPSCADCPAPDYTSKARDVKYQGVVLLDVVVNPDGRAGQITVVKGPGLGLEENAIKAVKKWKFKPAIGPDGNPVAVLVPIEITFRM
jgi:TonB family protein